MYPYINPVYTGGPYLCSKNTEWCMPGSYYYSSGQRFDEPNVVQGNIQCLSGYFVTLPPVASAGCQANDPKCGDPIHPSTGNELRTDTDY